MNENDPAEITRPSHRPSRLRNYAIGMALGSAIAIVGTIAIVVSMRAKELPPITFEILDAAVSRWSANGPADYDMDIEQSGVNPALYHVEVRHGNVVAMTMNNRPTPPHTWDDWSVPGLFTIIRRDLEVCMAPHTVATGPNQTLSSGRGQGEGDSSKSATAGLSSSVSGEQRLADRTASPQPEPVVPRGLFDPQLGYPTQYHRVTPTGADAKWRITKFTAK